jgi:hypothetical protein
MSKKWVQIGMPALYVFIVVWSLIVMLDTAGKSAFCGIYAMIFTMPWSLLFTFLSLIFVDYDSPNTGGSLMISTIITIVSALLNLALYFYFTWPRRSSYDGSSRSERAEYP